jgi:hypothetical protein
MRSLLAGLLVALLMGAAWGTPVAQCNFEEGITGWTGLRLTLPGPGGGQPGFAEAPAQSVTEPANVKSGQRSLGLGFTPEPGVIYALGGSELKVAGAKSLRMWAKSTTGSLCMLSLREADGSDYQATVMLLPDQWQEIRLNLSDLALGDDSQDENGTLDADQVNGLGLVDAAGLLGMMVLQQPLFEINLAPRSLYVDDVVFDSEETDGLIKRRAAGGGQEVVLGDFEGPTLTWAYIGTGNVDLLQDPKLAGGGTGCLQVRFDLTAGKLGLLINGLMKAARLTNAQALRFKAKCSVDCPLLVQIEEKGGGKYNKPVELKAGDVWTQVELPFAQFQPSDDSKDNNGRLDLDQAKSVLLMNLTAAANNAPFQGVLWLDDVAVLVQ